MLFIILTLAAALLVASPYIVIVYKRRRMLKRLKYVAHASGFRVRHLHRAVCLSLNRTPKYDLLFENRDRAFAVKLWSATRRDSSLVILPDGRVAQVSKVPTELHTDEGKDRTVITGMARRLPRTKQNFNVKKDKPVDKFLLCYPPNKNIFVWQGGKRIKLSWGATLFGKVICLPSEFERMLLCFKQNKAQDISKKPS